ncbi:DNA polymerase IV [Roseibaca ekhonensis]|uniref:DNA polymerase IV n=1 Tax=Roseinatronobacter ekhonensis TaxID=254356 RepID=A0A3B0M8X6_9RHOB|nr:DNA polymerase IV [Roseibaca ekhonensis]SUZ32391.1 DNA polymerase IV [Roseibaca ekhonensis]
MPALCRECLTQFPSGPRCPRCHSRRVVAGAELFDLSIAHMDCDAFYASVEKRDNPELRDKPVIVGGGRRGVVTTACYIARIHGVRSAMPMFKALQLCPEAVVVKPRFEAYTAASRDIRALMEELTPAIEPLSLDEAFLDLSGTAALHGAPPAVMLARLVRAMEHELGLSGSIGLSHNKFLAKIASDLDKPRGFSVIAQADTEAFLRGKPVGIIWGVGTATRAQLDRAGIATIDDLLRWERADLVARFGSMGMRLYDLARGQDARPVSPDRAVKSISKETTFGVDLSDPDLLEGHLWRLAEQVSSRAKARGLAGRVVTVKLKRADHRSLTRRHALDGPTALADTIWRTARPLLLGALDKAPFRLIGVGISELVADDGTGFALDLLDQGAAKRAEAERTIDRLRQRFGPDAVIKGRSLR